jgi:hypothetical protein
MSAPRLLLLEVLDAVGADVADARERVVALRAAGAVVRAVVCDARPLRAAVADPCDPAWESDASDTRPEAAAQRLAALAAAGRFDLAVIASSRPWGGEWRRALPAELRDLDPCWWPTGFAPEDADGSRGEGPVLRARPDAGVAGMLEWATVDLARGARRRLTLWDGDYVLVPGPLAGEAGSCALRAFAALVDESAEHDLVVLAPPQPAFEREARALGVGTRVHFAGHAPREAEWAWWAHASAAIASGATGLSSGLVLRGLAVGAPWVLPVLDAPSRALHDWLGVVPSGQRLPTDAVALAEALRAALAGDRSGARARARATRHTPQALAERLGDAWPELARATGGRAAA